MTSSRDGAAMPAHPYLLMALNNAWANETLYAAVAGLRQRAFTAKAPGFFPSLAKTLNHILLVDRFYLAALEGAPAPYADLAVPDVEDAVELGKLQQAEDLRLNAFCRGLDAAILRESRLTLRDAGPVPERVDTLLLHLFQHQVHHRGQAHVQLQEAGGRPPQLDDFHLTYGRVASAEAWLASGANASR